jgi:hypothetical protein
LQGLFGGGGGGASDALSKGKLVYEYAYVQPLILGYSKLVRSSQYENFEEKGYPKTGSRLTL